jgi:transcription elongation factor GreA
MSTQLSPEAHARLSAELEDLVVRGRVEIAKRIEEARALGDLKENGEYHAAKEEQGKMELRVRQLKGMLDDVAIVVAGTSDGAVQVGATVTIDFGDGDTERYLVGNIEEKKEGVEIVSPDAPLGKALLGRSVGDDVAYEVNGTTLAVKLVGIE